MTEFDLIARIRARARSGMRGDVLLGIGDDAAVLQVPAGRSLVVATDTLNSGVHFLPETAAADIGWKALAVNLSDLAAMGAQPAWSTLSLSLPAADGSWLDAFLDGFLALAAQHDVALVGGDTTRGPLSVCVTAQGFIDPGAVLRRDGARAGDDVWVTGTLGDAAAALSQSRSGVAIDPQLRVRLDRPTPRVASGLALAGVAHAAIDVSDGLLADLAHICMASGVGARVDIDALPASAPLLAAFEPGLRQQLQAAGGDDYELCFTAPERAREALATIASQVDVPMIRIGRITEGHGVEAVNQAGDTWSAASTGYAHFGDRVEP